MASGFEDFARVVFTSASKEEQKKIDATDAVTDTTFDDEVKFFLMYNDGPNSVHYKDGTGATTNNQKMPSGSVLFVGLASTGISHICAASETATVYVIGLS